MREFARVGDRFHIIKQKAILPGEPNIALCGTIYIPHTIKTDETKDDYPYCYDCHRTQEFILESQIKFDYEELLELKIDLRMFEYPAPGV